MRKALNLRAFLLVVALGLATAGQAAEVIVKVAPPPPVSTTVVGVAPGRGYVWIQGYHRWNGSKYVWVPGKWVVPPRPGTVWVPPRWVQRPGGYVFVPGHWR
jgi:hypothetical protein